MFSFIQNISSEQKYLRKKKINNRNTFLELLCNSVIQQSKLN